MAAENSTLNSSEVILFGNPLLRTPAKKIEDFSPTLTQTAKRMGEIMRRQKGVGIAAQQCGFLGHLALIEREGEKILPLVNGEIIEHSEEWEAETEGCLSLPGVEITVPRFQAIRLRGQDLQGEEFYLELHGREARIVQHELDHLRGRLILDYLPAFSRLDLLQQITESGAYS